MSKGKNLKGSDFNRQIKNIINRTLQLGVSKRNCIKQNQIHSINVLENRQKLLKEFKVYLESQNIVNGKMNNYMNEEHLRGYIYQKIENLSYSSSKTVISSMSGIITSLKDTNVKINLAADFFSNIKNEVKDLKYEYQSSKDIHKSFNNVENVVNKLYEKSFSFGLLGETLNELGLRFTEGVKLLLTPNKFIRGNIISGLKGKSGKVYQDKNISNGLKEKIYSIKDEDKRFNHKSFCNSINMIEKGKSPHSFRYEFTKRKYSELIKKGLTHKDTMNIISRELNHFRNTTPYYLNRI